MSVHGGGRLAHQCVVTVEYMYTQDVQHAPARDSGGMLSQVTRLNLEAILTFSLFKVHFIDVKNVTIITQPKHQVCS